ncbi:hypothetical protein [Thiobacillus sp. 65-1402]|uniref:hypothetical protein n=1 Tax=Thiobacillus sp. 65-1402 TaxID=1895861 RepID=UPI0009654A60|nr:hypothetical protein [Thiobacillus sp. 65-1402]OJW77977.1 MAG: hypothetical protein BGO62_10420 [Thiobacillus sp. 65-1402]
MSAVVVSVLPGAGVWPRLVAFVRSVFSRRVLLALAGVDTVVLAGHVYAVRARPLGVDRELVPALIRCSQAFVRMEVTDALYDDIVKTLSLGLNAPARQIESHAVSLWDLAPVIDLIARVNGLQTMEAGRADLGKILEVLAQTGTDSMPGSSVPPAGPGTTSTNA